MTYGVDSGGFNRKPLPVILEEIEAKAKEIFGNGIIQTPESPLGQLNGLAADLITTAWEIGQVVYQSYDPDQAEGIALDRLASIRLLERMSGENDISFRQAVTNKGEARIDLADLVRAVLNVDGVTYARVFVNDGATADANGIASHSLCVAVIGGDDQLVAEAVRPHVVPGIGMHGNTQASVIKDGYCRTIAFLRPVPVRLGLVLDVKVRADRMGCPTPSTAVMEQALADLLMGNMRLANGDDLDQTLILSAMARLYPNVTVVSCLVQDLPNEATIPLPYTMPFDHIASFVPADISITVVP